jgi:glyoxylase-like metal-dependent hydrolase (beta-lactamase superfamily II)
VTHVVKTDTGIEWGFTLPTTSSIKIFPVRSPTLPPATHTNVYVLDGPDGSVAVDVASPYPDEQARLDAALDALEKPVTEIVLTHHHLDHVSGARHLAQRLGVGVAAHAETARRLEGRVPVTRIIGEGDTIAGSFTALHTPGHAPGHLCFHDQRSGALLAGDMIASIGTIIIEPDDDGDMAVYLEQLRRLRALGARPLLPAHGPPVEDAAGKLDFYVKHRLEREAKVVAALSAEPRTVEELVPPSYPDVARAIYPLAARSLLAHLRKLEKDGRARSEDGRWTRIP